MSKIAQQLGITKSRVQRELERTARERPPKGNGNDFPDPRVPPEFLPHNLAADPELAERMKRVRTTQLETQEIEAQTRKIEAARRQQLLEHPDASGQGGALIAVVLQELSRMREEQRSLLTRSSTTQPPPPAPTVMEQLQQYRQMGEIVQSFAPAKPPAAGTELEFTVAMERLRNENADLAARREMELTERRERMASEQRRNDAVAKAIEQFAGPLAAWLEVKAQPAPAPQLPAQAPPQPGQAPKPVVVQPDEVVGQCPNCWARLAIAGNQDESCPGCGQVVVAVEGRIRARLPNGELAPPYGVN